MHRVIVGDHSTSAFRKEEPESLFDIAFEAGSILLSHQKVCPPEIDAVIFSSCSLDQYSASIIVKCLE